MAAFFESPPKLGNHSLVIATVRQENMPLRDHPYLRGRRQGFPPKLADPTVKPFNVLLSQVAKINRRVLAEHVGHPEPLRAIRQDDRNDPATAAHQGVVFDAQGRLGRTIKNDDRDLAGVQLDPSLLPDVASLAL